MNLSDMENTDTDSSENSNQNEFSLLKQASKTVPSASKSPIFTPFEKSLLLELVSVNKNIVENKKTDFGVNQSKKGAWDKISIAFCSEKDTNKRTGDQLKKAWHNMKRLAKKDNCTCKKKLYKTGGGSKVPDLKNVTIKVNSIIPTQMESLSNEFDCDNITKSILSPDSLSTQVAALPIISEMVSTQKEKENSKEIQRRKYKDARSSMIDLEYEEHRIRMTTLKFKQKTEERKLEMIEEQHIVQMQILNANLNVAIFHANANI